MPLVNTSSYMDHVLSLAGDDNETVDMPDEVRNWLARLRLLYGIPFEYFVPNAALLPPESVRFFYIDRNWTDRLVDGALSAGKTTTREFAHHQELNDAIINTLDLEEGVVRALLRPEGVPAEVVLGDITGMLMRSELVSSYPGLEVKAYPVENHYGHSQNFAALFDNPATTTLEQLPLLRMDRLAPDVLLCLWRGIPKLVRIEEPREGLQFGVDKSRSKITVKLRNVHDTGDSQAQPGTEVQPSTSVTVPVRSSRRHVLDIDALRGNLERDHLDLFGAPGESGTPKVTSAELATQLLQFPYVINFFTDAPAGAERLDQIEGEAGDMYTVVSFPITTTVGTLSDVERETIIDAATNAVTTFQG